MELLRNKTFAFIRYLMFFLFLGYYSSTTLFFHTHLVNGKVIIHSHPFKSNDKKIPFQSHKHSAAAFNLIKHLNELYAEDNLLSNETADIVPAAFEIRIFISEFLHDCNRYSIPLLRAPPIV